jgi:hypothetical protein
MRIWLALALVASLAAPVAAEDDDADAAVGAPGGEAGRPVDKGTLGVGIILGEPTGICARLYLADDQAVQGAVGSAFIGGGLSVHADYVLHPWILQDRDSFVLPVYVGPGARVIQYRGGRGEDSHLAIGLRGVVGMLFDFKDVPLDAFLEVAGVLEYDFKDGAGFGAALNAGAGVRYYF